MAFWPIPDEPHLTNKVRDKETWQKYKIRIGFEPGTPGRKANTITTELKRILSNASARYCIYIVKQPCLKEWSPATIMTLNFSFSEAPRERRHYIYIRFWKVLMEAAIMFAGSRLAPPEISSSIGACTLLY